MQLWAGGFVVTENWSLIPECFYCLPSFQNPGPAASFPAFLGKIWGDLTQVAWVLPLRASHCHYSRQTPWPAPLISTTFWSFLSFRTLSAARFQWALAVKSMYLGVSVFRCIKWDHMCEGQLYMKKMKNLECLSLFLTLSLAAPGLHRRWTLSCGAWVLVLWLGWNPGPLTGSTVLATQPPGKSQENEKFKGYLMDHLLLLLLGC